MKILFLLAFLAGVRGEEVEEYLPVVGDPTFNPDKEHAALFCTGQSLEYCIGSSFANKQASAPKKNSYLQLKPRYKNLAQNTHREKLGWIVLSNSTTVTSFARSDLFMAVTGDFARLRDTPSTVEFITHPSNAVQIFLPKKDCCLTVAECIPEYPHRQDSVCDFDVFLHRVKKFSHMKEGSPIICRPCMVPPLDDVNGTSLDIAQAFYLNPECAMGCMDRFVGDGVCQEACDNGLCYSDFGDCEGGGKSYEYNKEEEYGYLRSSSPTTKQPSSQPTTQPTASEYENYHKVTTHPSLQPTSSLSGGTTSPTGTSSPTTLSPTEQPSFAPTCFCPPPTCPPILETSPPTTSIPQQTCAPTPPLQTCPPITFPPTNTFPPIPSVNESAISEKVSSVLESASSKLTNSLSDLQSSITQFLIGIIVVCVFTAVFVVITFSIVTSTTNQMRGQQRGLF